MIGLLITLSIKTILKKVFYIIKILVMFLVIFYLITEIGSYLWDFNRINPKIRDNQLQEKPLRVLRSIDYI